MQVSIHGPVYQCAVTIGRDVPVVLDAAPDVCGVWHVAVVASHPLLHGAVLDPEGVSGALVICPEIRQVDAIGLIDRGLIMIGLTGEKGTHYRTAAHLPDSQVSG
jgi:hypothetical protein